MKHRVTEKSLANLKLGRRKGTNNLMGIPKKQSQKDKMSRIMREWCAKHPDRVVKRGEKCRGENHYRWNGGSSKLNIAIRRMTENRKWMDAVKARDKKCTCGSMKTLEAHHIVAIVVFIASFNIKSTEDARQVKELWDIANGITLCRKCHYKLHGRTYAD